MKLHPSTIVLASLASCFTLAHAQCSPDVTYWADTTVALRVGVDTVLLSSHVTPEGGDAAYAITTLDQTDSIMPSGTANRLAIGSPLSSIAYSGGTAATSRAVSIATSGYGNYSTHAQVSALDTCSGSTYPPFQFGTTNGQADANTPAPKPFIYANPQFNEIWVGSNYGYIFNSKSTLTAETGIPQSVAVPQWSLSGPAAQQFALSCTSCEAPSLLAINANPVTCNSVLTVQYSIGDLPPAVASYLVGSANSNTPGRSPSTNNFVDNLPDNTSSHVGYKSLQYWNITDQCGDQLSTLQAFELFPNGFTSSIPNNWNLPSANQWVTGLGGWVDTIGEYGPLPGMAGVLNPLPTSPQNPLNGQAVYFGQQQIWAGLPSNPSATTDTLLKTQTQTHYVDHGLSQ